MVETEVRIDHHNPKGVKGYVHIQIEKSLKYVHELGDDALAVKNITTSSDLNTTIRKNLHRFGTVQIMVRQCNLIIKRRRLELPFETL
jgi:hypothetical protein